MNPTADLPIKLGEFGIDGQGHGLTGCVDQLTTISDQGAWAMTWLSWRRFQPGGLGLCR